MGDKTGIQWTDATWNLATGCTKVSPECANCYIDRTPPFRMAGRTFDNKGHIPLILHPDRLDVPLRWTGPRMVFVDSLTDLFHVDNPDHAIDETFAVMALARQHIFQVLTKRQDRMRDYTLAMMTPAGRARLQAAAARVVARFPYLATRLHEWDALLVWPLPNVWGGVSAGNQRMWDLRVQALLAAQWAVRWVSSEPLLEKINMRNVPVGDNVYLDALTGCHHTGDIAATSYKGLIEQAKWPRLPARLPWIDWLVFGGESGQRGKIRALHLPDVRYGLAQCRAAFTAAFVKQMGEVPAYEKLPLHAVSAQEWVASQRERPRAVGQPHWSHWCRTYTNEGEYVVRYLKCQDRKGGDPMEWPEDLRVRQWPKDVAV
jgi:protein gp37